MGKARIIESLGAGKYTIEVIEARERAELSKQQATSRIAALEAEITALQGSLNEAQQSVDRAADAQELAIAQYQADMAEGGESSINLAEFAQVVVEAASLRDSIAIKIQSARVRIAADEALIERVNALPPLRQMQAWCADLTEDLSGEVATAELPGEIGNVIIKPGFEGANQWSADSDGAMQPALASTPAGTFWNLAMMPGWQKWRPTYRAATIIEVNGDTCSIDLEGANSSQQGLSVNAKTSYQDVPILYMDCNGQVFEPGEKVLVAFAGNVNSPVVCGFLDNPKDCIIELITISDVSWGLPGYPLDKLSPREEKSLPWLIAENAGVAMQGGDYTINKTINKEKQIDIVFNINNSTDSTFRRQSFDDYSIYSYTSKSNHVCEGTGFINFLGSDLSIKYRATTETNFSYSYDYFLGLKYLSYDPGGTNPIVAIAPGVREYEDYLRTTDLPAYKVTEALEIGSLRIDVNELSTYIYNRWGSDSEWMRYFPALTYMKGYGSRGISKPYNILLPDILPFRYDGHRALLIVFSSTGSLGLEGELGDEGTDGMEFARQIMERTTPVITVLTQLYARSYISGVTPNDHRNGVDKRKIHYLLSYIEIDGVFTRMETPYNVYMKYRNEKVRGNNFDTYREIPLDISF